MFKYFSIKGVMYSLKRYWILFGIITIMFGIIGTSFSRTPVKVTIDSNEFVSTRSYLVSSPNFSNTENTEERNNENANLLIAILSDTSCQYKIIARMSEDYSNEQISEFMGVAPAESYSVKIFEGLLSITRAFNSSIINITFVSSDKDFSESVLKYYSEYIEENGEKFLVGEAKVAPLNETITVHTLANQNTEVLQYGLNLKNGVIFAFLGFVLSVCIATVIALIIPPISDVKSFEEYGLKVYCKNIVKSKGKFKFVEDIIKRDIINCGYKKIAIISTNEKFKKKVFKILESFKIEDVEFLNIANVTEDFEAFSRLKECEAAILIESAGITKYNKFEKLISLLSKYEFNIMGIALE